MRSQASGTLRRLVFGAAALIPAGVTVLGLANAAAAGRGGWGKDFLVYWDAAHRWAEGGSYYLPWQLTGPYLIRGTESELAVLHPPSFIPFAAPFALLPREIAALPWIVVPTLVIAWAVWRLQPPAWSWPILGLIVGWPPTAVAISTANVTLAGAAALAVALATRHRWVAAFVLLKPSLAPFALPGLRTRRWWIAALAPLLLTLPFAGLWLDWIRAIQNAQDGGVLYSLPQFPIMALPVIAWLAGRRESGPSPASALSREGQLAE